MAHDGRRIDIGPAQATCRAGRAAARRRRRGVGGPAHRRGVGRRRSRQRHRQPAGVYLQPAQGIAPHEGGVASPIVRQAPGYYLRSPTTAPSTSSSSPRTAPQARDAVAAGDWARALTAADAALALLRVADCSRTSPTTTGWRPRRFGSTNCTPNAVEYRVTALLAVGRMPGALADAAALRAREPLRDRACWLHMLALYRAGRGRRGAGGRTPVTRHIWTPSWVWIPVPNCASCRP